MYQNVNEAFYIFQVTIFFTILKHYKSLDSENKAFHSQLEGERESLYLHPDWSSPSRVSPHKIQLPT